MCGSCIAKVTPVLNEIIGENNWKIDTQNPNNVLIVSAYNNNEDDIIKAIEKVG